jgi:predicted ABC-type transport system involved in lysophospholipase L1 biosynthesis ATPase subunit
VTGPVVELTDVSKDYRALRPLRIERLTIAAAEHVAVVGLDQPSAEVLVNLITGATLPDRGQVRLFGRDTSSIADSADWLATVDRFGIVSERAVLLDGLSVVQNLAVPFTLEIEPPPADIRARATALAAEVGLVEAMWDRAVGELAAEERMRVRVGRALALDPAVLLLEHPSATLPRETAGRFGGDLRRIAAARGAALLAATADRTFADAVASRVLTHEPASGKLAERRRGWFGRR